MMKALHFKWISSLSCHYLLKVAVPRLTTRRFMCRIVFLKVYIVLNGNHFITRDWRMGLNDLQMVQAFTQASASVEGTRGGRFRLLDGNVLGVFTELVRNVHLRKRKIKLDALSMRRSGCILRNLSLQVSDEKIVMKWRYNNWPSGEHLISFNGCFFPALQTIVTVFFPRSS